MGACLVVERKKKEVYNSSKFDKDFKDAYTKPSLTPTEFHHQSSIVRIDSKDLVESIAKDDRAEFRTNGKMGKCMKPPTLRHTETFRTEEPTLISPQRAY